MVKGLFLKVKINNERKHTVSAGERDLFGQHYLLIADYHMRVWVGGGG